MSGLALEIRFHLGAQPFDAAFVDSERPGELLIDGRQDGLRDLVDRHLELHGLARERRVPIVAREGDRQLARLAALRADQARLEPAYEGAAAEHDRRVLALGAFDLSAVEAADEIDQQPIALLRCPLYRLPRLALLAQGFDRAIHVLVGDADARALDLDTGEVDPLHFGEDFELGRVLEALSARERLVADARAASEPQPLCADRLAQRGLDQVPRDLFEQLTPVTGLDHLCRHLARAKSRQLHLARQPVQALGERALELIGRDGHGKTPPQRPDVLDGYLHVLVSYVF